MSGSRIPRIQKLIGQVPRDPGGKGLENLEPRKAGQGDEIREPGEIYWDAKSKAMEDTRGDRTGS